MFLPYCGKPMNRLMCVICTCVRNLISNMSFACFIHISLCSINRATVKSLFFLFTHETLISTLESLVLTVWLTKSQVWNKSLHVLFVMIPFRRLVDQGGCILKNFNQPKMYKRVGYISFFNTVILIHSQRLTTEPTEWPIPIWSAKRQNI